MPDDTTQASEMPADQPTETGAAQATTTQQEPFDRDRAMATITKLREFEKEALQLRKTVADYERQKADAAKAEMSEMDRLKAELAELQPLRDQHAQVTASVETMQAAIATQVQAQIKALGVPKHVLTLLETLPPVEQLNYLSKHGDDLRAQTRPVPDLNGRNGSTSAAKMTTAQIREMAARLNVSPRFMAEQYGVTLDQ